MYVSRGDVVSVFLTSFLVPKVLQWVTQRVGVEQLHAILKVVWGHCQDPSQHTLLPFQTSELICIDDVPDARVGKVRHIQLTLSTLEKD